MKTKDIIDNIVDGRNYCVMDFDLLEYHRGRISPLVDRIVALEKSKGLDGREIELRKGLFPDTPETPDIMEHRAILWRLKAREGATEDPWQCLVFLKEIRGPEGLPGPTGEPGHGMEVRGVVEHQADLVKPDLSPAPRLYDIYMVHGVNEAWIYYTNAHGADHQHIRNWQNLGKIAGIKGDKGDRGPRGPQGDSGGIGAFMMQFIINQATSAAINAVMMEANTAINDAINDAIMAMENALEDVAQSAVDKAIDDMMDQFKGEKGEKGDKGDKGKDGKSVEMVGAYEYLTQFRMEYPAVAANVGKAALIGADYEAKRLWCIVARPAVAGIVTYQYEDLGDIRGPKGDASEWTVSIRDEHFVQKGQMFEVVSDLPEGVAGLYIQDTESITVTGIKGSPASGDQVGFKMSMKYPIPTLVPNDSVIGTPTVDKFLTNNGTRLEWADVGFDNQVQERLLLKSPNGITFAITVKDDGRLNVEMHDDEV